MQGMSGCPIVNAGGAIGMLITGQGRTVMQPPMTQSAGDEAILQDQPGLGTNETHSQTVTTFLNFDLFFNNMKKKNQFSFSRLDPLSATRS